jgi:hypothetical protein
MDNITAGVGATIVMGMIAYALAFGSTNAGPVGQGISYSSTAFVIENSTGTAEIALDKNGQITANNISLILGGVMGGNLNISGSNLTLSQNQFICFYNATGACNQWIKANSSGIFAQG